MGSTSLTTDANGNVISEMRYTAWGEVRYNSGVTPTDYTYTGQYSYAADFGLMFYNARWYDPALGRFAQADSIVPPGVQGLDSYAYVNNSPMNYVDPSGHVVCEIGEPCGPGATYREEKTDWRKLISDKFGITISDEEKVWDETNLIGAYSALIKIDKAMNGNLKTFVDGATFYWDDEYIPGQDYHGYTRHNKTITFYTRNNSAIPQMNIFHEFGHLIDSLPGPLFDVFSNDLDDEANKSMLVLGGYINENALLSSRVADSNYPNRIQAIQASKADDVNEQWADIFANYVAGNIDMTDPNGPGIAMDAFVRGALSQHIGAP